MIGKRKGWITRHGCVLLFAILFFSQSAAGYVLQTIEDFRRQLTTVHWTDSQIRAGIPFLIHVDSFPFAEADMLRIVRESFLAWEEVETAAISFREQGTGRFRSASQDGRNMVVYDATGSQIGVPPGSGVIAVTRVNWNNQGEITDADIVFNGRDFQFSITQNNTPQGQVDMQDVLTHEIGHFVGLDHTPLVGAPDVRPTMNPFLTKEAPRVARSLEADDRAGISALYPSNQAQSSGSIFGSVRHSDGRSAFGVHVVTYQAGTNTFVASALSGALDDGGYQIAGLPPGAYQVAIEPLNGEISHQNFGGIFDRSFDANFKKKYYNNAQIILVEAGGETVGIDFVLGSEAPTISNSVLPANTPDQIGPYQISAQIQDNEGVIAADLVYRIDGGTLQTLPLGLAEDHLYVGGIPGQKTGRVIEYRLRARDGDGNETVYPEYTLPMFQFEVFAFSGEPVLYVAMRHSNAISVFDTGPEREVARIFSGGETPLSVVLSKDGKYLFVANIGSGRPDNRIAVIETATHKVAAIIEVGNAPLDMAISPDGRRIYVSNSEDLSVSVLDVAELREIRKLPVATAGTGPFGILVAPDGARLYVTDIEADRIVIVDAELGNFLGQVSLVPSPRSMALSARGDRLYVAGFNGGISVVDTDTRSVLQTIDTAQGVFRLALSADGKRLFASDPFDANLVVVDLEQNQVVSVVPALSGGLSTRDLTLSEDGRLLYVSNQDSDDLLFFDTASLQIVRSFKLGDGPRGIAVLSSPFGQEDLQWVGGDFDGSGQVDFSDFLVFALGFGASVADLRFDARLDFDRDDRIGFFDFLVFAGIFGRGVGL